MGLHGPIMKFVKPSGFGGGVSTRVVSTLFVRSSENEYVCEVVGTSTQEDPRENCTSDAAMAWRVSTRILG